MYDSVHSASNLAAESSHAGVPDSLANALPNQLAKEQLEQILDFSSEIVTCVDRHWRFTFLDRAARDFFSAVDLLGETLWTRYPANQNEPFASNYRKAMEDRVQTQFEAFAPATQRWLKIRAQPFDGGLILFSTDITERKLAVAVRDRSESQLQQVLDATTDAVVSLDRDFNYTFLNRQAELLLGRDNLLGKNMWREFPSTEADPFLRRTMEEKVACEFEVFNPAPLDRWFRVQTRSSPEGIVVFFRDVTEERASRQVLLAQQDTLAYVQQTARVATWEIDLVTRRLTVNRGSSPVWGRPDHVMTSAADFYAAVHPDDREILEERHRLVWSGGAAAPLDYRVLRPDGEMIWVEGRVTLIRDSHGVPHHLRGVTMDITARKNAEALRDAAAHQLEQVLAATTDAVVSVNRDWTMTFVNPQARRMLGREDLVGKDVWEEFPAALESQIYRKYNETMATGKPNDFEEFYPAPMNIYLSIQVRASADGIVVFSHDVTENRLSRQRLLDQQSTLAFVQQTALVATWIVDLATGSMSIAEGSYPVFGLSNKDIQTGQDFRRVVHPEDLAHVLSRVQEAIAQGGMSTADYRVIDPDGSIRWLEGRGLALYNEQGIATHFRGLTTDITARKQDEQRLRASEERYRVLADLNPQTLWIGEADGRISYTNQGHAEYRGVEQEALLGTRWNEGFHPDDREPAMKTWMHSVVTGEDYAMEARIPNSEGEFRWWALRGLPLRDDKGKILNWMGVAHDIHDMKMAAEELRRKQEETERQRAELETVYRTAPIALALYDPVEFRYLRVNDHLCETLGLPADQIVGRAAGSFGSVQGIPTVFREVANGRVLRDYFVEGTYTNGGHRFFTLNCSPVYASDGTIQAIASASIEITHQKRAEAALIQSEKLAAVGRLASSISHEINNPLEAITNLLYILRTDATLSASSRTYVETAQNELARVSQIATQTLRFHRQAVNRTWVSAPELVNSVLNLYQGRLSNSGIVVETTYAGDTPIFCYENDIRQVLNNLIANAIDAMRSGGRLVVRSHNTSVAGGGVRITIADTGHGMSADTMARIFEPFYTTKDLNGTGLGLWISKGIVDHHAGALSVRSSRMVTHQGTVFTLKLPWKV